MRLLTGTLLIGGWLGATFLLAWRRGRAAEAAVLASRNRPMSKTSSRE